MQQQLKRHRIAATISTAALAGGLMTAVAPGANAASCASESRNASSGSNILNQGAPMRTGPRSDCPVVLRQNGPSAVVRLQCWKKNGAGNYWWRIKHVGTGKFGWAWEENMVYDMAKNTSNRCRV